MCVCVDSLSVLRSTAGREFFYGPDGRCDFDGWGLFFGIGGVWIVGGWDCLLEVVLLSSGI